MIPWEREIYLILLQQYIEEENLKAQQQSGTNTNIQNPKLTISTIKSPLTDGGFSLGNVGKEGKI